MGNVKILIPRWVITKDKTCGPGEDSQIGFGYDQFGNPFKVDRSQVEGLKEAHALPPTQIRMYDDDDKLYFEGYTWDINEDEERAFHPLDWAMNYAGAVYMKYLEPAGNDWMVL